MPIAAVYNSPVQMRALSRFPERGSRSKMATLGDRIQGPAGRRRDVGEDL